MKKVAFLLLAAGFVLSNVAGMLRKASASDTVEDVVRTSKVQDVLSIEGWIKRTDFCTIHIEEANNRIVVVNTTTDTVEKYPITSKDKNTWYSDETIFRMKDTEITKYYKGNVVFYYLD